MQIIEFETRRPQSLSSHSKGSKQEPVSEQKHSDLKYTLNLIDHQADQSAHAGGAVPAPDAPAEPTLFQTLEGEGLLKISTLRRRAR